MRDLQGFLLSVIAKIFEGKNFYRRHILPCYYPYARKTWCFI